MLAKRSFLVALLFTTATTSLHVGHAFAQPKGGTTAAKEAAEKAKADAAAKKAEKAKFDKATAAFKQGLALYQRKKYPQALEQFQLSYDTVPSPNSLLYVARCQVESGDLRAGYVTFEKVIAEAEERSKTEAKYAPTRDTAKQEAADLTKKLAIVSVDVVNAQGGSVTLAGAAVPQDQWGKAIIVDPGTIEAKLEMPGRPPVVKSVTVEKGTPQRIELDGTPPMTAGVEPPKDDEEDPAESGSIKGVWLGLGIGSSVLAIGGATVYAVSGFQLQDTIEQLDQNCPNADRDDGCTDLRGDKAVVDARKDDASTQKTVANIGFAIGVVGVAGAATFFTLTALDKNPPASDEKSAGVEVTPVAGPGYLGVRGKF